MGLLLSQCFDSCLAAENARPNILMIAVDDLNDWVGCMNGHPNAITPNIDRLAASGTLFTNAHCQAPICAPSRASLFTGLRPSTSGIYLQIHDKHIRDANAATKACTFLPDYFEQHGYTTLGAGKLFHRGDFGEVFDEHVIPRDFGPKPAERLNYDPAWFPDRVGKTQTDWGAYPDEDSEMPDHKVATWAEERLFEKHDKPFFLAVGFCRPHVPLYVPQKWFDKHPLEQIKTPLYFADDLNDVPPISLRVNEAPQMPTTEWAIKTNQWKQIVQAYLACSTFVDHQIGRVLDALAACPHAENTIVILWTDHGYHLGEKNRFAKQALWERACKVTMIITTPDHQSAQLCNQPVELLDIYPTLLELCNLPPNLRNEGASLVPLLKDTESNWPHVAITSYGRNNHSIRSRDYRYTKYEDGSEELYDHQTDPSERYNLANDATYNNQKSELLKHLPKVNAALVEKSSYDFNQYFLDRMADWRK